MISHYTWDMKNFFHYLTHNWLWSILSLLLALIILLGAGYVYLETQLPDTETLAHVQLQVPLRIYSADHHLIASFGNKRRIPVTLDQIPRPLVQAVLATEDRRYYEHPGVDFIGILRAAKAVISSGKKVQGASTITMQVARNFFLNRKKTYSRKITEILLALKIDREFSKQKILELYLNKVYLGNRAYGVAAAAQVYYGKTLSQLSLAEMAMIGGLPQAPSSDNPIANPQGARDRRAHVLERMLDAHFITTQDYKTALGAPLTARYHAPRVELKAPYIAEQVRQAMLKQYGPDMTYNGGLIVTTTINSKLQLVAQHSVEQGLVSYSERHGYLQSTQNLGTPDPSVRADWLKILKQKPDYPPLQPAAVWQVAAQAITVLTQNNKLITIPWSGLSWARLRLDDSLNMAPKPQQASDIVKPGDVVQIRPVAWQAATPLGATSTTATHKPDTGPWQLSQIPQVQSALVSMNPSNGAITSMVGGFNFYMNKFNRATQAARQPGSIFKPFIYSAALNKGYTLASIINDAPIVRSDSGENQLWRPHNVNLSFNGPTRLMVGLSESRNLVSIRLLNDISIPYALNYTRRFGFNPKLLPHSLSLALGTAEVSPLQIATGYSVFANGGFYVTPHLITSVKQTNGTILQQNQAHSACAACLNTNPPLSNLNNLPLRAAPQTLSSDNAYLMTHALKNIIQHGTGRAARRLGRHDLAGKTGSTNKQVDAWFAGFNPNLVTVVWTGFDDLRSLHEYGAQAALPTWIDFMRSALAGKPSQSLPRPANIINVRIDPSSGLLARPGQSPAMFELFRQQYAPSQMSTQSAANDANPELGDTATTSGTQASAPNVTDGDQTTNNSSPINNDDTDSDEPLF